MFNGERQMKRLVGIVFAGIGLLTTSVEAHAASNLNSEATAYAGVATVTNGFQDRYYGGVFSDTYFSSVGVHADISYVDREENGLYGALGLSFQATDTLRPKIMVGTSTGNFDILPKIYVSLSTQYKSSDEDGWTFTPSVAYRQYRNKGEETLPSLDFSKYFKMDSDESGYWAVQGHGAVSFNNSSSTGYSAGGGLQTVRSTGLTAGVYAEGGRMTYDSIIGIGVQTDYWAIRPSLGYQFSQSHEFFVRGEYTHTDFYNVTGALIGFKVSY
jgi:hypothetical protein